ncbi:hypothetical protein RB195_014444 [Necator americanus]|uniref:Reverse transcriptase domain-containing protein n=1 Tax=Necator americanus TaxID=51031 RepID=A0ABR1E2V7_NECAM
MLAKNCTSPGLDRIKPGHLKHLPPVFTNTLAILFTRQRKVPKQRKTCKTVLLYKKGDPQDIGKYRLTCLLSVIYKLFTRVILNRIERTLDEGRHASKQGFEKGSVRLSTYTCATLENAMRELEWDDVGVKVDGRHLQHLRFADDIVLITSSINQAEQMLAEFDETCEDRSSIEPRQDDVYEERMGF